LRGKFEESVMKSSKQKRMPPPMCPVCGGDVPSSAPACPGCGADYNAGWGDDLYDGVDIPDGEFDYESFVGEEFGMPMKPRGISPFWWVVGILLVIAIVLVRVL